MPSSDGMYDNSFIMMCMMYDSIYDRDVFSRVWEDGTYGRKHLYVLSDIMYTVGRVHSTHNEEVCALFKWCVDDV